MNQQQKLLAKFIAVAILAFAVGLISYPQAVSKVPSLYNGLNKLKINLGLDLQGGIHLEYQADTSQIDSSKVDEAMQAVQDVIERRVNAYGVAEPVIYTTKTGTNRRLIVELAGVKDINQAKNLIKETPILEFKEEGSLDQSQSATPDNLEIQPTWISTGLTGKNLTNARVDFNTQGLTEPIVDIQFDSEGTKIFAELTKKNLGKRIAIFLDNELVSAPTVQSEIINGKAQISGNFTTDSANALAKRLNEGALPVPINLVSQQSIEASLGQVSLEKSFKAGIIGLILVIIFMLVYYRFLGLIASIALLIYTGLMISIFKLSIFSPWQITLTLPGIAGFILSIGMAVDANILIFERTKEEIRRGRNILNALSEGFKRAWTSIRDGNVSSLITAFILLEMGTGFVKGFAFTLIIGVLLSMFTAVIITRTLLNFLVGEWIHDKLWLVGVKDKEIKNP